MANLQLVPFPVSQVSGFACLCDISASLLQSVSPLAISSFRSVGFNPFADKLNSQKVPDYTVWYPQEPAVYLSPLQGDELLLSGDGAVVRCSSPFNLL